MFYRNDIAKLRNWAKEKNRKPLILRGARQVGKTTLVELFSKDFDQYIYLNLEKANERNIFDGTFDIPKLLDAIFFLKDAKKDGGKTLLFIDEIQNSPNAVATLRYFYEEAKHLYVIAAGSLLETLIDKSISFPVGRVSYMPVRPCNFNEFLIATKEEKSLELINSGEVPDYAHDKLTELFKTYTIIGGMPEILQEYSETRDMSKLGDIYDRLIVSYQDDVEKYAHSKTSINILRHIIDNAFRYAGSRIKFARFGKSDYRSREVSEAFKTLEKTMLLQLVYPITSTKLPLEPKTGFAPKLLMVDTGLVNYSAGLQKQLVFSKRIDEVYSGKIAEHITGQELLSLTTSVRSKLNFWVPKKTTSQAEVDFIFPWKDIIIPIEVKSGSSGRLRSLHRFIDEAPHDIAIRVYAGKYNVENSKTGNGKKFRLINVPFYLVEQIENILMKFDV